MSGFLLTLGLVLFVGLVVVHEFGHYIAARRNGVDVEEFGIGIPPRAWGRELKNGVLFSLNWLPLGGFVRLKGEHDSDRQKGSYGAASLWAKSKIMLAGVGMNLLTAWVLFTLLAIVGIPRLIDNQFSIKRDVHTVKQAVLVSYVEPGSPADKAGLKAHDQIVGIGYDNNTECGPTEICVADTESLHASTDLPNRTKQNAGQIVPIEIKAGNKVKTVTATLRTKAEVDASQKTDNPKGYLGVAPLDYTIQRYTWSAPVEALGIMVQFTKLTLLGIGHAIGGISRGNTSQAAAQVSGPLGIFFLLKDGSLLGYQFVLVIVAVISLTLAIINLLPIPALDGGRLFVTLLFRVLKKPLTDRREDINHGTGFAFLMVLFVLITIVDVDRFF